MNRIFAVNIHLVTDEDASEFRKEDYHFIILAEDDLNARQKGIKLAHQDWKNLYGKEKMPFVDYCEIELAMILSEEYYDEDSVNGG